MNSTQEKLTIRHTPIEAMELPAGWFEDFEDIGVGRNTRRRRFHSLHSPTAEIFTYDRGMPVDSASMGTFRELLAEKPKTVLPATLQKMKAILENMSYPESFKILIATTQVISGRTVLVIEGRWSNDQDAYAVFMPEGRDSRYVVEIHYQAIKSVFPQNLHAVKASISSIKWQDN
jgi:hypothetical protein